MIPLRKKHARMLVSCFFLLLTLLLVSACAGQPNAEANARDILPEKTSVTAESPMEATPSSTAAGEEGSPSSAASTEKPEKVTVESSVLKTESSVVPTIATPSSIQSTNEERTDEDQNLEDQNLEDRNLEQKDIAGFHGFNLLNRRIYASWAPDDTEEWAFRFMEEYGFNFARIPIDYARLYDDPAKRTFNSASLAEMDRIMQRGLDHGVFILFDLHMVPGFDCNNGSSAKSVWNDAESLDLWGDTLVMMAERYKRIPASKLGFNPVNEPFGMTEAVYMKASDAVIARIRAIDENRPIFIDGLEWSSKPVYGMTDLTDVVASPHFYQPFMVTHYQAGWAKGADNFPYPVFPSPNIPNYLYGPYHTASQSDLKLSGSFPKGTKVSILVETVSSSTSLVVKADGTEAWRHDFSSASGTGEWKEARYVEEWNIWQNLYDRTYSFELSGNAAEIGIGCDAGDWLTFREVTLTSPDGTQLARITPSVSEWGVKQPAGPLKLSVEGKFLPSPGVDMMDGEWLEKNAIAPWETFSEKTGIPVLAGEFGVYNKTPHDVSLRVLEAYLKAFKSKGWGWSLWNLAETFGILDSQRADVQYEDWNGHKLDREMLDLLLKYK